jgi:hypothetical protein
MKPVVCVTECTISFQEKNGQFVLYIEFIIPSIEFDMGRQPKPKLLGGLSVASDHLYYSGP